MRKMGTGSGGGYGMNKVVHRPHGKTEPQANKYRPQGVSQYGGMQGNHVTSTVNTAYRGEAKRGGRGYEPPGMISDPVKAVGVGGGRTIYKTGTQDQHGNVNAGSPRPNAQRDALSGE